MNKWPICMALMIAACFPVSGKVIIDDKEVDVASLSPDLQKRVTLLMHNFGDSLEITLLRDNSRIFEIRNFSAGTDKKYGKMIRDLENLEIKPQDSLSLSQGRKKWLAFMTRLAREAGYPEHSSFSLSMDKASLLAPKQTGTNSVNPFIFNEYSSGIPIDNANIYGVLKGDRLSSIWFRTYATINPEIKGTTPSISFDEALKKYLNGRMLPGTVPKPEGSLWYCPLINSHPVTLELCWRTVVGRSVVFLSALTGEVVRQHGKSS
jgi:hypothetical protein